MPLYTVYKVLNGDSILDQTPNKNSKRISIEHPSIENFVIKNETDHIFCSGTGKIRSKFAATDLIEDVSINIIVEQYKLLTYALVSLSGEGLKSIKNPKKYINDDIFQYFTENVKKEYQVTIDFVSFDYSNDHFSTEYWGEEITSKYGYYSKNKMFIKIKCQNLEEILATHDDLKKFYTNGIIKSISGKNSNLVLKENEKKYSGSFRFTRQGLISSNLPDLSLVNSFVKKLIDQGFFSIEEK